MRIVFFGTPEFAAHSLEKILQAGYNVAGVVTAPDKPAGRGLQVKESEVKKVALSNGLKVLQPEKLRNPEFIKQLTELHADLGIVIAFRMLPEMVWSMPRLGTFNLHASLLPQYRGAAPINHAIIQGETKTGLTTFFLKHEIDTGDLLLQQEVEITPQDTAGSLHDKLMEKGADLVLNTLKLIVEQKHKPFPQQLTGNEKTAPKIHRDFCRLVENETITGNHNKVRGLSPIPCAWIETEFGPMKIIESRPSEIKGSSENGNLLIRGKNLYFKCTDGWLELIKIQPANKPVMEVAAFINGLQGKKK
jgi:methionyl-tRNA formyltransferase